MWASTTLISRPATKHAVAAYGGSFIMEHIRLEKRQLDQRQRVDSDELRAVLRKFTERECDQKLPIRIGLPGLRNWIFPAVYSRAGDYFHNAWGGLPGTVSFDHAGYRHPVWRRRQDV